MYRVSKKSVLKANLVCILKRIGVMKCIPLRHGLMLHLSYEHDEMVISNLASRSDKIPRYVKQIYMDTHYDVMLIVCSLSSFKFLNFVLHITKFIFSKYYSLNLTYCILLNKP